MSLPRYPEYKDSGVEWLGEVPAHWTVAPLKRGFDVRLGKMLQPAKSSDEDVLAPYLRAANIQWGGVDLEDVRSMWFSPRERELLALQAGDLLVSEGGDVGRSSLWRAQMRGCYFQNSVNRVRARGQDRTDYLYYWMATIKAKGYVDVLCNKSTIAHFTAEKVAAVPTIFPEPQEQRQIASFLDHETAKIDALIAEQEKLLALLAEKRQATISHAVTRGLDPNVPMKDSGIPWLGEVPAHWRITPLKYLVSLRSGGTPSKNRLEYWDGDVPWASAKDLKSEMLADTTDHLTEKAIASGAATLLPTGTVLVVVRGMILARTFPVTQALVPMAINQDLKGILPRSGVEPDFLAWLLRGTADESLQRLDEAGHGTKALRMDAWTSMPMPVPPCAEQCAIAAFLVQRTAQLDELSQEVRATIQLLQERRSALIAAAVTGRIDVRGCVEVQAA